MGDSAPRQRNLQDTNMSLRIYDNSNLREMTLSNKTRVFNNLHTLSSWSGRCINAVGAVDQTLLLLPVKLN